MTQPFCEPNFDRVARIYRWAEYLSLGPVLQRTRTHFIPLLGDRRCGYVPGDGDGRFLAAALHAHAALRVTATDTSQRMLALLKRRCLFAGSRLQTHHASALSSTPPAGTDLVVTHFFLDCLDQSQVDSFIQQTAEHCLQGTFWLVSDFQIPTRFPLRHVARAYIRLLYFAFHLLTGLRVQHLPDTRPAFIRAGFTRVGYHQRLAGLVYTELWQLGRIVE